MKVVHLVLLLLAPSLIDASTIGQGTCSSSILDNSFNSVSTVVLDIDAPPTEEAGLLVDDVSFFTDILGYDDAQIDAYLEEEVFEFYLNWYGLDFANSVPDENRRRQFENATLFIVKSDPAFGQSFASNADPLISGIKVPEYNEILFGEVVVSFSGPQLLRGTYGGEDGIYIGLIPGERLVVGFYHCAECPPYPLIMPLRTITPQRIEPNDGNVIFNVEFEHPELGTGLARGFGRVELSDVPGLIHTELRLVVTFPTGDRC